MPLPVLQHHAQPNEHDLLRLFDHATARWTEHLAQPQLLPFAQAYINAELSGVGEANHVREVVLPPGLAAAAAFEQVAGRFASAGTRCGYWVMNASAPAAQTQPMVEYLLQHGHCPVISQVFLADQAPANLPAALPGLTIIPSRASFRHAQALLQRWGEEVGNPQLADAATLHLDDPHCDSLLALRDGQPLGQVSVLAAGQVGRIDQLYVAPAVRRLGLGQVMLGRALEICARSLFAQVMVAAEEHNWPAVGLLQKLGFTVVGQTIAYVSP